MFMSHVYDRSANPLIKENLETHEKNLILQRVDRLCFSTLSIFSNPFSYWGVGCLLKHYLALFVTVTPAEAIAKQKRMKLSYSDESFLPD